MAPLIAIEGIDGSGKGTQAQRLQHALADQGYKITLLSFPRYEETTFGRAIGKFLNGHFGSLSEVHPQLAALLFAGDRFESKSVIQEALTSSDVVICDRYVASNVAHQAAKLEEPHRAELMDWIQTIEFDVYLLPRPELTLLLDVKAATARGLIARKAVRTYTDKAADLQEADTPYLERVRQVYRQMARADSSWQRIDAEQDGQLRTIGGIAADVISAVQRTLSM